ncbi:MAG: hypothetical protein Q8L34_06515, partial [Candidatus Woesearchaeota archaeon]|nr:hypothetical protein [Candidatus Woesearchaeota archaeon]
MTDSYTAELWKRTTEENVKRIEQPQTQPYLSRLHERLLQLRTVLQREQKDSCILPYLDIVVNSISCLQAKHTFEGQDQVDFSLTIDPSNSGFPTFKDFYLLEKTQERADASL